MHKTFLVLIFFSFPLIIFSQQDMTDEEILKGKEQLKKDHIKTSFKIFFIVRLNSKKSHQNLKDLPNFNGLT